MRVGAAGIEPHHAGGVGDRFDAGEREHDADKAAPVLPKAAVQRLQMSDRSAEMRETEKSERDDDDHRWNGDEKGEAAGVLRPEQIQQADDEDGRRREFFRMRHAEILKRGKRADRRRDQVIGDEQKRADDGDDFGAMTHAGVNAAAIRIKPADDDVVDPDERGQNAHRGDQPERRVAADGKSQADDVGFARAPVAVQNRGRARHIYIARSLNVGWDQILRSGQKRFRATKPCLPLMMLTRLAVGLEPLNALDAAHRSPRSARWRGRKLGPPLDPHSRVH